MHMRLRAFTRAWRGKRVLIAGVGTLGGGAGAARFFSRIGAKVILADLLPARHFSALVRKCRPVETHFGVFRQEDFLSADLIVRNPALYWKNPLLEKARAAGIRVCTEAEIFFSLYDRRRIIGVSGTKGKSTAAALLAHVIGATYRTALVGVPGSSALSLLLRRRMPEYVIYELSNFMLEDLSQSPRYAVLTNFLRDHLNRYNKSVRAYWQTKYRLFGFQRKSDKVFLCRKDSQSRIVARRLPKTRVRWFEAESLPPPHIPLSETSVGAAHAVARELGITDAAFYRRSKTFRALEGRTEEVGLFRGVRYINDSAATNPAAMRYSLALLRRHFGISYRRFIVIAGGTDKALAFGAMAPLLRRVKQAVLLPGDATVRIERLLRSSRIPYRRAADMSAAVRIAATSAHTGDVVVLSPGAASFGLFRNEFDRGRTFVRDVKHWYARH